MDGWQEVEQIQNLGHSWLRDKGQAGQFRLVPDFPAPKHALESNRERHQSRNSWNTPFNNLFHNGLFLANLLLATLDFGQEQSLFDANYATTPICSPSCLMPVG